MSKSVARAAFPPGYAVPRVWQPKAVAGRMAPIPSAAPRSEAALPEGQHRFQLYSLGTPNGIKVTWMFEEIIDEFQDACACAGDCNCRCDTSKSEAAEAAASCDSHSVAKCNIVQYDAFKIDIMKGEQFSTGFTAVNPNQKIPALVDKANQLNVFESANICVYVCQQTGSKLLPSLATDVVKHTQVLNWVFWLQSVAPNMGNFGQFYSSAPVDIEYGIDRFAAEFKRVLDVLERHFGRTASGYVVGDTLTLADIVIAPWIAGIDFIKSPVTGVYAREFLNVDEDFPLVVDWLRKMQARPAFQRGKRVNGFGPDAIEERHDESDLY